MSIIMFQWKKKKIAYGNLRFFQFRLNQYIFIVPTEENPGDYLTYSPNGEMRAVKVNPKGIETINILKLNAPSLVKARRTLFIQLKKMSEALGNFEKHFNEYPTFLKFFKENY